MSKVIIKGMVHSTGGAGPALSGNTGMFTSVALGGAGLYNFVVDPEFPLDPNDTIAAFAEGATPLLAVTVRITDTTFAVRFLNSAGIATDPANLSVIVEGLLLG